MITTQTETIEELEQEVSQILPFARFDFNEIETVILYAACQQYNRYLSERDDIGTQSQVINLMARLREKAVEAARALKGGADERR